MWKGLKEITNCKTTPPPPPPSTVENKQQADNLNKSYCRFNKTPHTRSGHLFTQSLAPPATPLSPTPAIKISEDEVCQVFRKQKSKKAPGPDGVTPACLKTRADQLAPIFTNIFNRSLELHMRSPFMLQTLHHHPHPKGIQNYRTKLIQACGSNVCGHEVIWKTGSGPPEGNHWTLAESSSVCLEKQTGLWAMQSTWDCIMFCNI